MRAKVDKDSCISCGACVSICPEVFEFDDDGFAVAIEEEINEDDFEKTKVQLKVAQQMPSLK